MNKGDNLPHSARVMLATYMLAIGKPFDEIVLMFENAPDFNEKITRYQVEHLAGMKGSHTKYSVPSCDKIRNENLCFCDGPMRYTDKSNSVWQDEEVREDNSAAQDNLSIKEGIQRILFLSVKGP